MASTSSARGVAERRVDGRGVGDLLREWRGRRRQSQLELASAAGISSRHVSFIETGRSRPTASMILRIADHLDVPLRERNQLLLAGGYAPAFAEHRLDAPELRSVRAVLRRLIQAHMPFPALVLDRLWNVVEANEAVATITRGCSASLLTPPVNVIRLSLHPDGLAPRIVDLDTWRSHLLSQLAHRLDRTGDRRLAALLDEVRDYPCPDSDETPTTDVAVGLRLRHDLGELSFLSMAASVQTALDVTVDELGLEIFHPADEFTRSALGARVS